MGKLHGDNRSGMGVPGIGGVADPDVSAPLLSTKFTKTRLPSTLVVRPRLIDAMSRSVRDRPLTLLSALAGSGKSVLAASWMASDPLGWPVAWISLDDGDSKPGRFWSYVVEALERCGITMPTIARPLGREVVDHTFLIRLASALLEQPQPVVLVLDDFDLVSSVEVTDGLDFLLRHAFPRFRLVISGRCDPTLPLHRYRLSDDLTEIRQDGLAFTASEARQYLAQLGLSVSDSTVDLLTLHTEGWVAGLRLAAMSLPNAADERALFEPLESEDRAIAEYLLAEVLNSQPEETRRFLLSTSVSDVLWPALADELTGRSDGVRKLAELAHANIFMERTDGPSGGYRVSSLVREMLLAQLSYESPELVPELHSRCARWFAANGQKLTALSHAATAGDWAFATDLVIGSLTIGTLLVSTDSDRYAQALRTLPDDLPGADAAVIRSAVAFADDDRLTALREMRRASALIDRGADSVELQVSLEILKGSVCAASSDGPGAVEASAAAEPLIARMPDRQLAAHPELVCLVHLNRANGLLWSGAEESAAESLELALQHSVRGDQTELRLICLGVLALVEACCGRFRRGVELARLANRIAEEHSMRDDNRLLAPLALSWIYTEQYDRPQARKWIEQAERNACRLFDPLVTVIKVRLLRWRGDLAGASQLLYALDSLSEAAPWVQERVRLEESELQLSLGRPELALSALDAVPEPPSPRAQLARSRIGQADGLPRPPDQLLVGSQLPLDVRVEAQISACRSHLEAGAEEPATAAFEEALRLARPELLRRPFLQSDGRIRRLMRQRVSANLGTDWLDPRSVPMAPAADSVRSRGTPEAAVVLEDLSERETEVLRYLAELRSTEEIGAAMFVSVNTVRTHVRSILRKLAVPRRNEAVRRARELHLL